MSISGYFSITRPLNSAVSGLAAVLGYLIATGTITLASLILVPVVFSITAAGNVINDYYDAEIDAINRPERPIPSGALRKGAARSFALTLFLAGILISLYTGPLCIAIALINSFLLTAYAARLKSIPLVGNITVSYLTGSIFLFGGAFSGLTGLALNLPLAVIAFLATLSRELLKDAEDIEGDASGGARTLPMLVGIRNTSLLALVCSVLAVGASLIPFFRWGILYLTGIAVVDGIIITAAVLALPCATSACLKNTGATTFLKAGFFLSLAVFSAAAYLL